MIKNRIARLIPILILGPWYLYKQYYSLYESLIFEEIGFFIVGLLGVLFFIYAILKDIGKYRLYKSVFCFIPSGVGVLFLTSILSLQLYQHSIRNSETLVRSFYDGGFNGVSMELKIDGTYIMANGSGLGQWFFYGTYKIENDLYVLDKNDIDNCIKSRYLNIQDIRDVDQLSNTNISRSAYLIQTNKNGKKLKDQIKFRVTKSNLKLKKAVLEKVFFDKMNEYKIAGITKMNNYPSSATDTSICAGWDLISLEIKSIINKSEMIDGAIWHHSFDHLPCAIEAKIEQGGQSFELSINGGSWFTISSKDTTVVYGSFKKEHERYFLSPVWKEEIN
jgi:hypothetical protein